MVKHFKVFFKYRTLLNELIVRDIKVKYRRSVLGLLWTLLNPLFTMLILSLVFSHMFRFNIENFPVYLLCGQLIFSFFSEATNGAMNSILGSASLIKKVYVPKYLFPLAKVLSTFVNLVASFLALIIVMLFTRTPIQWTILLVPAPIFYVLLFSIGIGLVLSSLAVFFRDVIHLYGVLLTAWMYLTPIFYPLDALPPNIQQLVVLNPLTRFILMFRQLVLSGTWPPLSEHLICLSFGIIAVLFGLYAFYKSQNRFVLYL